MCLCLDQGCSSHCLFFFACSSLFINQPMNQPKHDDTVNSRRFGFDGLPLHQCRHYHGRHLLSQRPTAASGQCRPADPRPSVPPPLQCRVLHPGLRLFTAPIGFVGPGGRLWESHGRRNHCHQYRLPHSRRGRPALGGWVRTNRGECTGHVESLARRDDSRLCQCHLRRSVRQIL